MSGAPEHREQLRKLAKDALAVQNACNLLAVLHGAARVVSELREIMSWDEASSHPITQLWADKIASLTATQTLGDDRVMDAYREVGKLARGD